MELADQIILLQAVGQIPIRVVPHVVQRNRRAVRHAALNGHVAELPLELGNAFFGKIGGLSAAHSTETGGNIARFGHAVPATREEAFEFRVVAEQYRAYASHVVQRHLDVQLLDRTHHGFVASAVRQAEAERLGDIAEVLQVRLFECRLGWPGVEPERRLGDVGVNVVVVLMRFRQVGPQTMLDHLFRAALNRHHEQLGAREVGCYQHVARPRADDRSLRIHVARLEDALQVLLAPLREVGHVWPCRRNAPRFDRQEVRAHPAIPLDASHEAFVENHVAVFVVLDAVFRVRRAERPRQHAVDEAEVAQVADDIARSCIVARHRPVQKNAECFLVACRRELILLPPRNDAQPVLRWFARRFDRNHVQNPALFRVIRTRIDPIARLAIYLPGHLRPEQHAAGLLRRLRVEAAPADQFFEALDNAAARLGVNGGQILRPLVVDQETFHLHFQLGRHLALAEPERLPRGAPVLIAVEMPARLDHLAVDAHGCVAVPATIREQDLVGDLAVALQLARLDVQAIAQLFLGCKNGSVVAAHAAQIHADDFQLALGRLLHRVRCIEGVESSQHARLLPAE